MYFTYGKEDAREGYGTVEWVDDYGTLGFVQAYLQH